MKALVKLTPALAGYGRELAWVLARAFGPVTLASDITRQDGARALDLARRLGLCGLIATRASHDQLAGELGAEVSHQLVFDRLRLLATNRELTHVRQQVSEVSRALGVTPLWLKFAALSGRGFIQEGVREARDIDLLLSDEQGDELYRALLDSDFKAAGRQRTPHQMPALLAPSGAAVEVHRFVWGVGFAEADRGATFDDFQIQRAVVHLSDGSLAPTDELLVAHALVHAIAQHRTTPKHYAPFRVVADLIALQAWRLPSTGVHEPIAAHLTEAEVSSACSLARALQMGTPLGALTRPETMLLQTLLAASLDADFQNALSLERWGRLVRERRVFSALWRTISARRVKEEVSRELTASDPRARVTQLAWGCIGYARLRWRSSLARR